jgi:hypothetical protein
MRLSLCAQIFDALGNFLARLPIYAVEGSGSANGSGGTNIMTPRIVGLQWFRCVRAFVCGSLRSCVGQMARCVR